MDLLCRRKIIILRGFFRLPEMASAAMFIARIRRKGRQAVHTRPLAAVNRDREPIVQGMLLEMTPRGLRVRATLLPPPGASS